MDRRHIIKLGAAATASSLGGTAALANQGAAVPAPNIVPSDRKSFSWRMSNAYGQGTPFYHQGPGSPGDFVRMVDAMSGGRLKIQHFGAGELIPALGGFDAVSKGTVEMNCANSYFWANKLFAAQYFTAVPFGLNAQGMNAWLYHGGGLKLWEEIYAPYDLIPMPMGNTGVQMTGWFRKPIESVGDLKGLKMRIPGLAGKVYALLGVQTKLLPAGEIYQAFEKKKIDAAEFVGPYQDRRLGLHKVAKVYHTTGWHETSTVTELIVNRVAWSTLPSDLQEIVRTAAAACNVLSQTWCEQTNALALDDLVTNFGVRAMPLPADVVGKLKEGTEQLLDEAAARDTQVKRVHESFMGFKAIADRWSDLSEGAYHRQVRGQLYSPRA